MSTRPAIDPSDLRRRADALSWHHQIDLGQGVVTQGRDRSDQKLAALQLPSLAGRSVLDVGAWDGYFSFAAERLGAARVRATDSFAWGGAEWGSQESFHLAREALGSRVEEQYIDVMDLGPEEVDGRWDVVLCLGVLYHMRDPMLMLERVASVTGELLVLETLVDLTLSPRPVAAFYPGASMNDDDTNWWGPNDAAVVQMCRAVGFDDVRIVSERGALHRARTLAYNAANIAHSRIVPSRAPLSLGYATTDRVIVHARRSG